MEFICEICGNEVLDGVSLCPFCGVQNESKPAVGSGRFSKKTVNLEIGRPVLDIALHRMNEVIADAKRNGVHVLTLIHGYGSSGKGGIIRQECRKTLEYMKIKNDIRDYICGEDFNKRAAPVKAQLNRFPELALDRNLNRGNRGITLVILN
ncbi:Smr/MutS family protein [Desulforhopalus sp. IMCC35007]|uniref:Smr/MutS family protein n=1 Tax=Desulforhopalus sp. IMCC35007 TaxID=2569543 RepID=UPI0010AE9E4C|nr:Smr/MutS family protein [Desulforhopalus sp. IMCC35007]TKB08812.1 hypothetical protein FCL48_12325 [Desulforhopalus sp. IMCC35007]